MAACVKPVLRGCDSRHSGQILNPHRDHDLKILLTGAAGFTGRHFAAFAAQRGHSIVVLDADLCDAVALQEQVEQREFTHVVHLAAISFVGHADDRAFYDVNLFGALNLLQALTRHGVAPQRVLLASSANVYGNARISPITELASPAPVNHYATSKLAMECMARTYGDQLPILITRPFNYTGRGQNLSFLIPKLVSHYGGRAGYIELGNLDVAREFNDVRMVCDAYLRLLESGVPGETYNVCSGRPHALRTVIAVLEQLTDHELEIRINPALVRANEVQSLCGDPDKLWATVGQMVCPRLQETLEWMLAEEVSHGVG